MGKAVLGADGHVKLTGSPPYELGFLDKKFLDALFSTPPGEEGFIADLTQQLRPNDKVKLRVQCRAAGEEYWGKYKDAASKWASVVYGDNKWDLEDFDCLYEAEINSGYAHRVVITTANIRFVRTVAGELLSFPEFNLRYGRNILDELDDKEQTMLEHLRNVRRAVTATMVWKNLIVADSNGCILCRRFAVLKDFPLDQQMLPDGCQYLSEG